MKNCHIGLQIICTIFYTVGCVLIIISLNVHTNFGWSYIWTELSLPLNEYHIYLHFLHFFPLRNTILLMIYRTWKSLLNIFLNISCFHATVNSVVSKIPLLNYSSLLYGKNLDFCTLSLWFVNRLKSFITFSYFFCSCRFLCIFLYKIILSSKGRNLIFPFQTLCTSFPCFIHWLGCLV